MKMINFCRWADELINHENKSSFRKNAKKNGWFTQASEVHFNCTCASSPFFCQWTQWIFDFFPFYTNAINTDRSSCSRDQWASDEDDDDDDVPSNRRLWPVCAAVAAYKHDTIHCDILGKCFARLHQCMCIYFVHPFAVWKSQTRGKEREKNALACRLNLNFFSSIRHLPFLQMWYYVGIMKAQCIQ